MRRRTALCAIILALSANLYATMLNVEVALGPSVDASASQLMDFSIAGGVDNWRIFFQTDMGESFDLNGQYDIPIGETFHNTFSLANQFLPGGSGTTSLSSLFYQHLDISHLDVEWGLGLQVGMFWSVYTKAPMFAFSPLFLLSVGLAWEAFDIKGFFTMSLEEERSWRATPALAIEAGVNIDAVRFFARGYAEFAEFLMNPYFTVASYGLKCGLALGVPG